MGDGYVRYPLDGLYDDVAGQAVVMPSADLAMEVQEDDKTLELDFRVHSTWAEPVDGMTYCRRPGIYLSTVLPELLDRGRPAVLLNGNNTGWWGNQFVIRAGQLVYKRRGPVFADEMLCELINGRHAFFVRTSAGFGITRLTLSATPGSEAPDEIVVQAEEPLPEFGVSGFPLLRGRKSVWESSIKHAWDPRLLFDVRTHPHDRQWEIRKRIRALLKTGPTLVHHAMTVVGIDVWDQVVLLVVEQSDRSVGMTVAEAADLLKERFLVRDAIVLGAAGDAQLATTDEGFLVAPLIAPRVEEVAQEIPGELIAVNLGGKPPRARPVPCFIVLRPPVGRFAPRYWFPPVTPRPA